MRYSSIICPHCGQQTQFDFDSSACYCMRCAAQIQRDSSAVSGGLVSAADRAFLCMAFSEARELYANAILSGDHAPYLYLRKAICGALLRQDVPSMHELVATYAQLDAELQAAPEGFSLRQALAEELLHFLQSEALFAPRDSAKQPFPNITEARNYCLRYCAAYDLVKDLYKYVPYDLLDQREALSRATQQLCTVAAQRVFYFQGSSRIASAIAAGTRMAATQTWNECANDLDDIQSLRAQQG